MAFLDSIKGLFKKKEISVEEVDKIISNTEKKQEDDITENRNEALEALDSIKIDRKALSLDKIESEAETVSNYAKGLIKDLGKYQDFKNDKEKMEEAIRAIGGKIRMLNNHGLELKNLLGILEDHYYDYIIEALKKVNEKANNEQLQKIIDNLEKELEFVRDFDTKLTRVVGYNELFNPEKNPNFKDEIEKEAMKRVVHGDLNELMDSILLVSDRTLGIKAKIEKGNILDKARQFV